MEKEQRHTVLGNSHKISVKHLQHLVKMWLGKRRTVKAHGENFSLYDSILHLEGLELKSNFAH